jgi:hypothetical protein
MPGNKPATAVKIAGYRTLLDISKRTITPRHYLNQSAENNIQLKDILSISDVQALFVQILCRQAEAQ